MSEAGSSSPAEAGQFEAADAACVEAAPARGRRNIVLLSDGTGNSPAKLNKTNVWRLYQALDLGADDQIAFYDDGVGTSGFRPLQILGGAFGWGLSRNVRDLYEFLCRHYQDGDHIYVFGFSRGAFTARTLAALIAQCGVLDCSKSVPRGSGEISLNTHAGLKAGVALAYKSYRRGYSAPVARVTRWLRDRLLGPIPSPDAFRRDYGLAATIKFVGVWDTVDAVGLPVDELSTMIDRIFYPHRFPDQDLSPRVERACHAIAIDDERYTFHPVLWNERGGADNGRMTQVWFAGMHSDVGGGYPDNDLAHVSLEWMIDQVHFDPTRGDGLRFGADDLRAIAHRAQPLGKMHDSRRGLGVYYRYKPRDVASLCDDPDEGVLIAEPKIHQAVFKRIAENTTGYAPPALPTSYRLVDERGVVSDPNPTTYETADQRQNRARLLERAQDHIFWRRVLYYLFVFATLAIVFMPYYRPPIRGAEPESWLETGLSWMLGWLPAFLPGFLSSWANYWIDAWSQSALWFLILAALYGWLLWHSRKIDANIHRLSEAAWWHVKQCAGTMPPIPGVGTFESLARRWRSARKLKRFHRLSVKVAVPVVAVVVAAYLAAGTVYRVAYHLPGVGDGVCRKWFDVLGADGEEPRQWGPAVWSKEVRFDTRIPCVDTGLTLRAGQRYVIEVKDQKDWTDGTYAAAASGLSGVSHLVNPVFVAGVPSRRSLLLPWFTLTGEIGRDSGHTFPLNRERVIVRPSQTGRLHLYVNDAINALGTELDFDAQAIDGFPIGEEERQSGRSAAWYAHYLNNGGTATITVRPDR